MTTASRRARVGRIAVRGARRVAPAVLVLGLPIPLVALTHALASGSALGLAAGVAAVLAALGVVSGLANGPRRPRAPWFRDALGEPATRPPTGVTPGPLAGVEVELQTGGKPRPRAREAHRVGDSSRS
jgi:hypothetical protein